MGCRDALLRRVPAQPSMINTDRGTPSSAAFSPSSEDRGISVWIRRLLDEPTDPIAVLDNALDGLAELWAQVAFGVGMDVVHVPLEGNYAHGNIYAPAAWSKSQVKRACKELAGDAAWVREPAVDAGS